MEIDVDLDGDTPGGAKDTVNQNKENEIESEEQKNNKNKAWYT